MRKLAGQLISALALLATLLSGTGQPAFMGRAFTAPNVMSTNWSGYALQGGPFLSASGTFTVPAAKPTCGQYMSEWVGVDGFSNADLLQAGIAETECDGALQTWAWWEILPEASVSVRLPVKPGDVVSVDISRTSSGRWDLFMCNDTTGQFFDQNFAYDGPATSAEWVVEAPMLGFFVTPLAPYGTSSFTGLEACCRAALLDRVLLNQGTIVSYPTLRTTTDALMNGGFVAHYK